MEEKGASLVVAKAMVPRGVSTKMVTGAPELELSSRITALM